jgi:uncharacterized protein
MTTAPSESIQPATGATSPPVPGPYPNEAFFWEALRNHEFHLLRCQNCGHFVHYPRPICDRCQSLDLKPEAVTGRGSLYSYTTIMQAGHPYFVDKVPYIIGVVDIEEEPGIRVAGGIDATEGELQCDIPVEILYKDITNQLTLAFFRPRVDGAR